MMQNRVYLAVPYGDPAGIGPEILLKAMQKIALGTSLGLVVLGDALLFEKVSRDLRLESKFDAVVTDDVALKNAIEARSACILYDQKLLDLLHFEYGVVNAMCGRAAYEAVVLAHRLVSEGYAKAIVTPPLHKGSLKAAQIKHIGYTEILADLAKVDDAVTMFDTMGLKIFFHSRHLSLRQACDAITKESLLSTIIGCDRITKSHPEIFDQELSLAVAALNPHAGDHGLFGDEEIISIEPAVEEARKLGIDVVGPIGSDSVFYQARIGTYRAVVSLYHDQGHIAAKTYDFDRTISVTWNLPYLRTSVDHGTAFDIAGKNQANEQAMVRALVFACDHLNSVMRV
ncbi:MAG: 4-hydroxythreonine-4-phosphate dehydrogenase [Spirochaetia bacterium]|nr:4-hydroxythreonine-4-phosphate dehydrogenase [Spirochaetia bacterium]